MLVEGQAHGGVVQGIGQALLERTSYDSDGQLLSGSFMDYTMPQAIHAPGFIFKSHPVPARTNALGAKGCGEAGCAGALPAVMNALADALGQHIEMPATPERVLGGPKGGIDIASYLPGPPATGRSPAATTVAVPTLRFTKNKRNGFAFGRPSCARSSTALQDAAILLTDRHEVWQEQECPRIRTLRPPTAAFRVLLRASQPVNSQPPFPRRP